MRRLRENSCQKARRLHVVRGAIVIALDWSRQSVARRADFGQTTPAERPVLALPIHRFALLEEGIHAFRELIVVPALTLQPAFDLQ